VYGNAVLKKIAIGKRHVDIVMLFENLENN